MKKLAAVVLVIGMVLCFPTFASAAGGSAYGSYGPNSTYSDRPLAVDGKGLSVTGDEFSSMLSGLLTGKYSAYQEYTFPVFMNQEQKDADAGTAVYYFDCPSGTTFQMICGLMDNAGNVTPCRTTNTVQNVNLWGFIGEEDDMKYFQLCAVNMIFMTCPADDSFSIPAAIMLDLIGDHFGQFVKYGTVEYKFDYVPGSNGEKDMVFFTVRNALERKEFRNGQIVTFGNYEQDGNTQNGAEPIEWIVVVKSDHEVLLVSRYGLDVVPFHTDYREISWEECELRAWMNDTFFNTAFSADEQAAIEMVVLNNKNGYETSTMWRTMRDGNDTEDRVFSLSCAEAEEIFGHKRGYNGYNLTVLRGNGPCLPTPYALSQGAKIDDNDNDCCYWWLRTVAAQTFQAAYVSPLGSEGTLGCGAKDVCVRPAILVDLNLLD